MRLRALLPFLACPLCGSELAVREDGEPGRLLCPRSHEWPVVRGIPDFTAVAKGSPGRMQTTGHFADQWSRFASPESSMGVPRVERDLSEKYRLSREDFQDKVVADVGCGMGRHALFVAPHARIVVGLDATDAIRSFAKNLSSLNNAYAVKGDILDPPLAVGQFDFVYSIGVLHHTADPEAAVRKCCDLVKPGGRIALYLYSKVDPGREAVNAALRAITTRLPPDVALGVARSMALAYGTPIGPLVSNVVNMSHEVEFNDRVLGNYDWYGPRYQWHLEEAAVLGWLREEGFALTWMHPTEPIRIVATKEGGPS